MASSSSSAQARSIVSPKLYDVFISHRGPDVKETLAKQLYDLLQERGCKAFLDREEIEGGDSIESAIHNAICSSRVQIAIFSKGYAQSPWCLNELVLMLEQTDALFVPVFYGVQPLELRHIEKDKSQYAAAFADYQSKGRHLDKLDGWKMALAYAAEISGYELSQQPDDLCEKIVSRVVEVVQEKKKSIPLHVAKYPVGLDELVQDFGRCCSKTAGMVGIFGLGGSGKTTLSKELYNKKRSGYHRSCFLSDVRESHARGEAHSLQRQLLKELFSSKEEISSVHHGIGELKDHLGREKHLHFLIVLDDIDHQDQLDALLPEDMRDSNSLVIITTRDQSVLRGVDIRYKMKVMDRNQAKDLFCSHAFRRRDPPTAYQKLVESFVEFCGGLPLSLIVLGAHVYERDENYWNLELEKVKKIQPEDIMKRLKISFDGLDKEEKQIFIDIACLFNKKKLYDFKAIAIWKASGWSAEHALQTLQHKCLIERYKYTFEMHDHLRDLGRQMADELGPSRLWQPEVLRSMEAKGFKQILAETKGRCFHSFQDLSLGRITYFIAETDLLWLDVEWPGVNKLYFPSWISLRKLHCLKLCRVEELWSSFQRQLHINAQATFELRYLSIENCPSSQKLPDSIQMLSHLEELHINASLEETDTTSFVQSLKQLSNLRLLSLLYEKGDCFGGNLDLSEGRDSTNLGSSTSSRMDSLEIIQLGCLRNISKLVISGEMCPRLQALRVADMKNLKEIELKQVETLNILVVYECGKLETISGLSSLTGLQQIRVHKCAVLKSYLNLARLGRLEKIRISECPELQRVEGISECPELQQITVEKCIVSKSFLNLAHLRRLEHITISECPQLQRVEGMEKLPGLKSLLIEVPDDRYAWALDYIHGLRTLSLKRIILVQKAMHRASSKLNASLFSEVIDAQQVSEIERGEYGFMESSLKMKSSLSAITIYALLVKSGLMACDSTYYYDIPGKTDQLITVLLAQNDSEGSLKHTRINKGYKAPVKVGEEGKALIVLQRIVDQYLQRRVPDLAAYDVVKRKRKKH